MQNILYTGKKKRFKVEITYIVEHVPFDGLWISEEIPLSRIECVST
jgi:hypothetical protein